MVVDDAGIDADVVNGIISHGLAESDMFVPATLSEYLGLPIDFGERVDLGGATSAGMVWRAAVAVELGLCDAVLAVVPGSRGAAALDSPARAGPDWYGASSNNYGSPQAEFEIPYGNVGQNAPYAQIAQRYGCPVRLRPGGTGEDRGRPAHATPAPIPGAVFHGQPITVDDVLDSPMIADPIHMLETVMPVQGGAGVLVANADVARRSRHRPVWIRGFGEHIAFKTPTYAQEPMVDPDRPGRRAGVRDGRVCAGPTSMSPRSTTATPSPC